MSKRFVDTELWNKSWYMELVPAEKLAFYYILSQCNNVGVWDLNTRLAEFQIGTQLDWYKFAGKCHGNILILDSDKWFIIDYVKFQHPDFNSDWENSKNNAVKSYGRELQKVGLLDLYISYLDDGVFDIDLGASEGPARGVERPQGKGKERVKVREQVKEEEKNQKTKYYVPSIDESVPTNETTHSKLLTEWGEPTIQLYYQKIYDHCQSTGKKYKDYASTARNWIQRDIDSGKTPRRSHAQQERARCPVCGVQITGKDGCGYCNCPTEDFGNPESHEQYREVARAKGMDI